MDKNKTIEEILLECDESIKEQEETVRMWQRIRERMKK